LGLPLRTAAKTVLAFVLTMDDVGWGDPSEPMRCVSRNVNVAIPRAAFLPRDPPSFEWPLAGRGRPMTGGEVSW